MAKLLNKSTGVALVEALVAMAVMGVGTLAVLGAQKTLRFNADLSKQRSEAVRMAQEQIEEARTFGNIADYTSGITDTAAPVEVVSVNATYSIARLVVQDTDLHGPRMKQLRVTVTWVDRIGTQQRVQLASAIHGTPPALAGSLLLPANVGPISTPGGRHRSIPPGATLVPNTTTSSFSPPGAPAGVSWTFNNLTGFISSICTSAEPTSCTAVNRRYLGGVIRFATAAPPAPPNDPPAGYYFDAGETPQGPDSTEADLAQGIGVQLVLTAPLTPAADCYVQSNVAGTARLYHCAVPVDNNGGWSGRIEVTGNGASTPAWSLASSITDNTAGRYRVCRYTPVRGCQPVVAGPATTDFTASTVWGRPGATATCTAPNPQTTPPTPSRRLRNDDFPSSHVGVTGAVLNQNFLIRKAADDCPADGPATQINTNTWHHQPAT